MDSQYRTLEKLTANFEKCQIGTNVTDDFFGQGFIQNNPIGPCQDFQAIIDDVTPDVSPAQSASPGWLPPSDFTKYQSRDSFVLSHIAPPVVNTQMASLVETYLVRLQAVHGQQLTVNEAILIIRRYLQLAHHYNARSGHFTSPSMPSVVPVEVSPMSFDVADIVGQGTSTGISMGVSAGSDTESAFGIYDMSSLRRIFVHEDRVKVECLWPGEESCLQTILTVDARSFSFSR